MFDVDLVPQPKCDVSFLPLRLATLSSVKGSHLVCRSGADRSGVCEKEASSPHCHFVSL